VVFIKKNYGKTIVTEKDARVSPQQLEAIAAVGSIVFIKGTRLWMEATDKN